MRTCGTLISRPYGTLDNRGIGFAINMLSLTGLAVYGFRGGYKYFVPNGTGVGIFGAYGKIQYGWFY
jgi:hypothetical protein